MKKKEMKKEGKLKKELKDWFISTLRSSVLVTVIFAYGLVWILIMMCFWEYILF